MNNVFTLTAPVLFIIFNRKETAEKVFEQIRIAKPKKLYIAADGPRAHVEGEAVTCAELRELILSQVDWDCELQTLIREENLGCKVSMRSAITWFFEHEEAGIILEDDCVPNQSFFEYCQTMLEHFKDDKKVMMISGTSYLAAQTGNQDGIYFAKHYAIWGWATWRRAWKLYEPEIESWPAFKKSGQLKKFYPYIGVAPQLAAQFDIAYQQKINTWDYQWFYTCAKNQGLTVVPTKNLISNIGLVGTHARANFSKFRFMKTQSLDISKIIFPKDHSIDPTFEKALFEEIGLSTPKYWLILLIKHIRRIKKKLLHQK